MGLHTKNRQQQILIRTMIKIVGVDADEKKKEEYLRTEQRSTRMAWKGGVELLPQVKDAQAPLIRQSQVKHTSLSKPPRLLSAPTPVVLLTRALRWETTLLYRTLGGSDPVCIGRFLKDSRNVTSFRCKNTCTRISFNVDFYHVRRMR